MNCVFQRLEQLDIFDIFIRCLCILKGSAFIRYMKLIIIVQIDARAPNGTGASAGSAHHNTGCISQRFIRLSPDLGFRSSKSLAYRKTAIVSV